MISSCPNYLHADVSDGKDVSCHQQEVTGGQLVTMSLVPGTVDSDVTLWLFFFFLGSSFDVDVVWDGYVVGGGVAHYSRMYQRGEEVVRE